ncbi:hypothetical protein AAHZ94_03175 [Streptomyces sp. HSW2009]|uniref:hypothetical protein n=1 Tax=Streptomyces sp. HSW2009 TaxID=3142890 RepID=UPI0032EEE754
MTHPSRALARVASPAARRLYALMSLHPTGTFTADVAQAVALTDRSSPSVSVGHCLATLHEAGLYAHDQGRYSMSPQAHRDAQERAFTDLRPSWDTRREAQLRLADHYLAAATEAGRILLPDEPVLAPTYVFPYSVAPLAFSGPGAARRWFALEHAALAGVLKMARTAGPPSLTAHLAVASWAVYLEHGACAIWQKGQHLGVDAARIWGLRRVEALLLLRHAVVLRDRRLPESALPALRDAASLYQDAADRDGLATTWRTTALVHLDLGRMEAARHALRIAHAHRSPLNSSARALDQLCTAELEHRTGGRREAGYWFRAALTSADSGSATEVRIRRQAALVRLEHGDVKGARAELEHALEVACAGDRDLMRTEVTLTREALTTTIGAARRSPPPPRTNSA